MVSEQEVTEQVTQIAVNAGAGALDVLVWVVGALCVCGLIAFIVMMLQYKHKVRIRYLTKDGAFIIDDKAKRKEEGGVVLWSLLKSKMDVSPPPKNAINITQKGNLVAECYITEDNPEPVWLEDRGQAKDIEEAAFKPLTTQQRSLTVSRIRKAQSRNTTTLWDKVSQVIMPIAMVIIIAIPFIFFGDITKGANEAIVAAGQIATENAKIAEQNARMLSIMAGKIEVGDLQLEQSIPANANTGGGS